MSLSSGIFLYGDCSSAGRAPDCDSGGRGFEPRQSPQTFPLKLSQDARSAFQLLYIPFLEPLICKPILIAVLLLTRLYQI